MPEARIDKWMWAVRIFKTRTIAAEACKKGRVTINGSQVKAARMIKRASLMTGCFTCFILGSIINRLSYNVQLTSFSLPLPISLHRQ